MSALSVQITGFDDFLHDIEEAGVNATPLTKAALQNSATQVQRNVRQRAPHRTGALQRSVLTSVNYPSALVSVEEAYGVYIEEGTRAHDIFPVNKKALYWSGAFSPVKAVHHPGTPARPFFTPGVNDSSSYIYDQFSQVVDRLIGVMAGR